MTEDAFPISATLPSDDFFARSTLDIAPALLGALLVRELPEGRIIARIVETEAYLQLDPACHGVRTMPDGGLCHRRTARNDAMFGLPGHAYVYFTYGNYFMLNVVTAPEGVPEAVLIRAVEPLEGIEIMARQRGLPISPMLTNGPGKLTIAFAIDRALDGHDLTQPPLQLLLTTPLPDDRIIRAPRIGISKAAECPYRFYERGNVWVSRR